MARVPESKAFTGKVPIAIEISNAHMTSVREFGQLSNAREVGQLSNIREVSDVRTVSV
jgi:hypothetical protein